MKIKTLVAAIALAATGTANAAIETSGFDGQGGEIFLTVWNPAAESSYALDLNVLFTDMYSVTGEGAGFTRDLSTDANWASVTAGATSGLQFAVTGGNAALVFNSTFDGYVPGVTGAMSTANDSATFLSQATGSQATGTLVGRYEQMISRLNIAAGANDSSYVTVGDDAYFDNPGTNWGNVDFIYDMEGSVDGGAIGFFYNQTNYTGFDEVGNSVSQLGEFTLSSAGLLSYTAGTAVIPVPAAVWLFGSGLLGLVGVARRRKQQA